MTKVKGITTVTSLDKELGDSHWRRKEESIAVLSHPESLTFHHWDTLAYKEGDSTKQGPELSSVPCDNFSTRRLRHRNLPQTLFLQLSPCPALSISPGLFNHPEVFRHSLKVFLPRHHPHATVPYSCSASKQSLAKSLTIPCNHFSIFWTLFFSTF